MLGIKEFLVVRSAGFVMIEKVTLPSQICLVVPQIDGEALYHIQKCAAHV